MFPPRGIPEDVDDATYRSIAHSFYVVRMVRLGLMLLFLVGFVVAVALKEWPRTAAVVLGVGALGLVLAMLDTRRRWLRVSGPAPGHEGRITRP